MLILLHGDNQKDSRLSLKDYVSRWQKEGRTTQTIDGQKISLADAKNALYSNQLFEKQNLVIENLLIRPHSKLKSEIIALISAYSGDKNIILWEKKEITKALINKFGNDITVKVFKIPTLIFKFLESLSPGNAKFSLRLMHECRQVSEEGFIFIMFSRHIAELIIAKSGDTTKLIPFKRARLISQATSFPDQLLISLHQALLKIDFSVKTGRTGLTYLEHLDLLILNLLN